MQNQIPKNWRKVRLGEVAEIEYGKDLPTRELKTSGFPVYGGNGIIGYTDKYLHEEPKIIVGCRGANSGNVFRTQSKSFVTHNSLVLNLKGGKIDRNFLFYKLLKSNVKSTITGSAQPQITIMELNQLEFEIPKDINEQKRIAAILSAFDDKIELNNKINQTLEQMAQAIFKEWFVNFRFPDHEKVKMVDSGLGKIPEGWTVKPLTEVVEVNPKVQLKEGSIAPYVEMQDLPTRGMWFAGRRKRKYKGGSKFQNGDTLFARITPSLEHGKTGYINCLIEEEVGFGSTEFIVLRPPCEEWREFVYLLARSHGLREYSIQNMFGTSGRQRVPADCFENFYQVTPPFQIIGEFHQLAFPMFEKVRTNNLENQKLASLRDFLLPKLMSGEVRV